MNWLDPTGESASDVIFYTSYGKFSVNAQDAVYFLFSLFAAADGFNLLGVIFPRKSGHNEELVLV